jgi:prophage maintenance system killer protein
MPTAASKAFKKLAEYNAMPEFLALGDVLESHAERIEPYGGSDGIRDVGLLELVIAQPEALFGGEY